MTLINGDCLEEMKKLETNTIDLLFCDLPYGQTSCKWDCLIDLDLFWKEVNRICKDTTPMFFTCSTKFGVSLINSNPKNFRYDLVWVKSSPCGFLNAKKMPMKKHEMIYVFYKKLPLYDLSSHTHKFKNEIKKIEEDLPIGCYVNSLSYHSGTGKYTPPLPQSVIRETTDDEVYKGNITYNHKDRKDPIYDPPLPNSVIKEDYIKEHTTAYGTNKHFHNPNQKNGESIYDPPLPNSVIKETNYINNSELYGIVDRPNFIERKNNESIYDPPLPNSILEIKSEKGKHATQKPLGLTDWILKYYSKSGDNVLDPTMGSGTMGISCKQMGREFIGIELDEKIFKVAENRINN
jgi:DNA modification methylase